jgi:hypothetical protein
MINFSIAPNIQNQKKTNFFPPSSHPVFFQSKLLKILVKFPREKYFLNLTRLLNLKVLSILRVKKRNPDDSCLIS